MLHVFFCVCLFWCHGLDLRLELNRIYLSLSFSSISVAGVEETGAEPDDAPEEAGGRAHHHRGEVREQEAQVSRQ